MTPQDFLEHKTGLTSIIKGIPAKKYRKNHIGMVSHVRELLQDVLLGLMQGVNLKHLL